MTAVEEWNDYVERKRREWGGWMWTVTKPCLLTIVFMQMREKQGVGLG
jgi:hypothetical protein